MKPDVPTAVEELRALRKVHEANRRLREVGIRCVVVGGRLLVADVVGALRRRSVDAALLVEDHDLMRARAALVEAGWLEVEVNGTSVLLGLDQARVRVQSCLFPGRPRSRADRRLAQEVRRRAVTDRHDLRHPDPPSRLLLLAVFELLVEDRPYDPADLCACLAELDADEVVTARALATRSGTVPALDYGIAACADPSRDWLPEPPRTPYGYVGDVLACHGTRFASAMAARIADRRSLRRAQIHRFRDFVVEVPQDVYAPGDLAGAVLDRTLALLPESASGRVAEVGTGSGAIALALARARPGLEVIGTDASHRAVLAARHNAARLGVSGVEFRHGSLLDPLPRSPQRDLRAVLTTVPYSAPRHVGQANPNWGLGPGFDGLDLVRRLASQATHRLVRGGWFVFLAAKGQEDELMTYLTKLGFDEITIETTGSTARWASAEL